MKKHIDKTGKETTAEFVKDLTFVIVNMRQELDRILSVTNQLEQVLSNIVFFFSHHICIRFVRKQNES